MFEKFKALLQKNGNLVIIMFTVAVILTFIFIGDQLPKVIVNNTTINSTGNNLIENRAQAAYASVIDQYNYTKTYDNDSVTYPADHTGNCSSYNCTVFTYTMPDTVGVIGVK